MVREIFEIVDFGKSGIAHGDSEDFLVVAPVVLHQKDADRSDTHSAPRKRGFLDKDQHVEGVAVTAFCAHDESIVARIMYGREQHTVEANGTRILVEFILVAAAAGYLDDGVSRKEFTYH
jgi:hypothetical protein